MSQFKPVLHKAPSPKSDNKPKLAQQPDENKKPKIGKGVHKRKWSFSFRFWRQIDYFGLGDIDSQWFASLLEKLKELSDKNLTDFLADSGERNQWRYHKINWNQTNIPIKRKDIEWLDGDYFDNEDEYPLVQFQVSTALGRVVGFFDESNIFNIVLLDPLHNIQPSKSYDYKVDSTTLLNCKFSSLMASLDELNGQNSCEDPSCQYKIKLQNLPDTYTYTNVVMHFADDLLKDSADKLLKEGIVSSYSEILQYGIDSINELNS